MNDTQVHTSFRMELDDVLEGLSQAPKQISSKYLYDAAGESLFRQIMELDEYYLTRAELAVLQEHGPAILNVVAHSELDIVELGAGDGSKTRFLLEAALDQCSDVRYVPIDIAESAMEALQRNMQREIPALNVEAVLGDYLEGLRSLHASSSRPELILFLGSNIGNYSREEVEELLSSIRECVAVEDRLLLGVDLKKDPRVIHRAYNDGAGLTRAFNMNLIERMRRELGASCRSHDFDHYESYDPLSGEARSYLVSEIDQTISFAGTPREVHLRRGEVILTEISRKFDLDDLADEVSAAGWSVVDAFTTKDGGFADLLLAPAP